MQDGPLPAELRPRRPPHLHVPDLGGGVGLRVPHYAHVVEHRPALGFFEAISENYFGGGKPRYYLESILESYPVVLHGVSLGIGGPDEPDRQYLAQLRELVRLVKPPFVSDHLCWSHIGGQHLHELLPLPLTSAVAARIARRARMVQDYLEVPFALENTSSYVTFAQSSLSEWEFISSVCEAGDVGLLLDVNNIYVSAFNHDLDALQFLRGLPHQRVVQIHVAGHTHFGTHIIDTHVGPTPRPVVELLQEAIRLVGPVPTLLEWDEDIPEFEVLQTELVRLDAARRAGLAPDAPALQGDVVRRDGDGGLRHSHVPAPVRSGAAAWNHEPMREDSPG